MKPPIGTRLHATLDYLTGTSLLAASLAPPLRRRFAGRALLVGGASHLGYSLFTDYELGAVRKLPYRAHLVLDALGAAGLIVAGAIRGETIDRVAPIGVGHLSSGRS